MRLAWRSVVRAPHYWIGATVIGALLLGVTGGVLGVIDAYYLRPLPFPNQQQVVAVSAIQQETGVTFPPTPAEVESWATWPGFSALARVRSHRIAFNTQDAPDLLLVARTSHAFFRALGTPAARGRTLAPADSSDPLPAIVLSHTLWTTRFGADPGLVTRVIATSNGPHRVVGVMPPAFRFPEWAHAWVTTPPGAFNSEAAHTTDRSGWIAVGRLSTGQTPGTAHVPLNQLSAALAQEHSVTPFGARVTPIREIVTDKADPFLRALLGATLVFFVSGATALGVLMALFGRRTRLQAIISRALGGAASHGAIQTVCAAGLLVGPALVPGLMIQQLIASRVNAASAAVLIDGRSGRTVVLLLSLAVLLVLLVCVVLGFTHRARPADHRELRSSGRATRSSRGFLVGLLMAQVGIATLQLGLAQVAVSRLTSLAQLDLGFDATHTVTLTIEPPATRYRGAEQWQPLYERVRGELAALPGVVAVGTVTHPPLVDRATMAAIDVPGMQPTGPFGNMTVVRAADAEFFRASGHHVVAGTPLTAENSRGPVAVVNEAAVRAFFGKQSAVGSTATLQLQAEHLGAGLRQQLQIVGVVADARDWGPMRDALPLVYLPRSLLPWPVMSYVIRSDGPPEGLLRAARQAVARVDPSLPVALLATTQSLAEAKVASYRTTGAIVSIFAVVVALLVIAGQMIVTWNTIRERRSELALHATLGATPTALARAALRPVLVASLGGAVAGMLLTPVVGRAMRVLLQLPEQASATQVVVPAAIMLLLSLLAGFAASRQIRRIDPALVLRS